MKFKNDVEIRELKPSDAWKLCDFIVSNEDRFRTYLPVTVSKNLNPTLSQIFVERQLKLIQKREEFLYTIKLKSSRQLIGIVYLKNIDLTKRQGEFAYAMDYRFAGNGIIPYAIANMIEKFKNQLGLTRFQIIVNVENTGSIRVAEKCNFSWIKTLPKIFKPPGKPAMDMELYELSLS